MPLITYSEKCFSILDLTNRRLVISHRARKSVAKQIQNSGNERFFSSFDPLARPGTRICNCLDCLDSKGSRQLQYNISMTLLKVYLKC